jgi:hypothetical protein
MRLNNYLTEEVKVEQYFPMLKKKCSMAVNTMKKARRPMFRGVGSATFDQRFVRKKVRQDRKPKDAIPERSEYLDKILDFKFGWKPRSEGLFVTSSFQIAQEYGMMFLVFPVGNFKYVWNKGYKDFLPVIGSRYSNTAVKVSFEEWRKEIPQEQIDKFTDKDIVSALRKEHEIMIKTPEYYGVSWSWIKSNYDLWVSEMELPIGEWDRRLGI